MANQQWQPIETAPKDGTVILLFEDDCISTAKWEDLPSGFDDAFGWCTNLEDRFAIWAFEYTPAFSNPTYWMSLPDKPSNPQPLSPFGNEQDGVINDMLGGLTVIDKGDNDEC